MTDTSWDLSTLRKDLGEFVSTRTVDRKNFVAPLKQRRDFISEKIGFLSDLKATEPLRSVEIEAEQGKWADLFTAYNRRIQMLAQWGVRDFNEDSAALQEQRQPFVFRMKHFRINVDDINRNGIFISNQIPDPIQSDRLRALMHAMDGKRTLFIDNASQAKVACLRALLVARGINVDAHFVFASGPALDGATDAQKTLSLHEIEAFSRAATASGNPNDAPLFDSNFNPAPPSASKDQKSAFAWNALVLGALIDSVCCRLRGYDRNIEWSKSLIFEVQNRLYKWIPCVDVGAKADTLLDLFSLIVESKMSTAASARAKCDDTFKMALIGSLCWRIVYHYHMRLRVSMDQHDEIIIPMVLFEAPKLHLYFGHGIDAGNKFSLYRVGTYCSLDASQALTFVRHLFNVLQHNRIVVETTHENALDAANWIKLLLRRSETKSFWKTGNRLVVPMDVEPKSDGGEDDSDEQSDNNSDQDDDNQPGQPGKRHRRDASAPSQASGHQKRSAKQNKEQDQIHQTDDADIRKDVFGRIKAVIRDADADLLLKEGYRVYSPRDYGPFEIMTGTHTTHGHRLDDERSRVFVKKVYGADGDRERAMLALLNSQELVADSANHTVPLLSFVTRARSTLLLFPDLVTLNEYVANHPVSRAIADDLMHQLKEGMEFMHKHKIAHFDLKPDNLLVDPKSQRLFISDFDLAEQFDRHDVEITGFRGNLEFTAPFVSDTRPYNPFEADRYSYRAIKTWMEKFVNRGDARN